MKKTLMFVASLLMLFSFASCNNTPSGWVPPFIDSYNPIGPVTPSNPFEEEAIDVAVSVIDSLDQQTIKGELITAVKHLFGVDGALNNPNLDHGSIMLTIEDEQIEINSSLIQSIKGMDLSEYLKDHIQELMPYLSYVREALNGVVVRDLDTVSVSSSVIFNEYTKGLRSGGEVAMISSGTVDVVATPGVLLLDIVSGSSLSDYVISVDIVGQYRLNSASGQPLHVVMNDDSEYDITLSDVSALFKLHSEIDVNELYKYIADGSGDITKAINNTNAVMYLPEKEADCKVSISASDNSGSDEITWKQIADAGVGGTAGPDASVFDSAVILPYSTNFGTVRFFNMLDNAIENDGTATDSTNGTISIGNWASISSLNENQTSLTFDLNLIDYEYATKISLDGISTGNGLVDSIIKNLPPSKTANDNVTFTFNGSVSDNKFIATGYTISANLQLEVGGVSESVDFSANGIFENNIVISMTDGIENANSDSQSSLSGAFNGIVFDSISVGGQPIDLESLDWILETL